MGKKEHELGEAKVYGVVLATMGHCVDERRRGTVVVKTGKVTLPSLD
jgi:hypothetical protein